LNALTLTVEDDKGQSSTDMVTITVLDTAPPQIESTPSVATLWPPNHRLVQIETSVAISDTCSVPSVVLASISSNEPDDAAGSSDGNTSSDIQGVSPGTADFDFQLRAERNGEGGGRAYQVTYIATDGSGNRSTTNSFVFVPHDQGGGTEPVLISVEDRTVGTLLQWDLVPGASFYRVIRGTVGSLRESGNSIDLGSVSCIQPGPSSTSTAGREDSESPATGQAFFYLVAYNDGRDSGYGSASAAKPRISTAGGCE
jgi:hypothetical protein